MTCLSEEEKKEVARLVAVELVRLASTGGLPGGIGGLAGNVDSFDCFTCSGWFKCRPSFLIQAPPLTSQPTG